MIENGINPIYNDLFNHKDSGFRSQLITNSQLSLVGFKTWFVVAMQSQSSNKNLQIIIELKVNKI